MDGFGVCLKTRLANNGLGVRNEEWKIKDKFYISRIRNWGNDGAGELSLEGKIKFGFNHLKPEMPVRYSDRNIKQTVVYETCKEQSGLDINIWKSLVCTWYLKF